jgi:uncharacterized protein
MYFIAHCLDKPDSLQIRLDNRPIHLAYLEGLGTKVVLAGPYLDASGNPCGSMLLFEAPDQATVEAWVAGDPYAKAGLFALVEVRPWRWVINPPKLA